MIPFKMMDLSKLLNMTRFLSLHNCKLPLVNADEWRSSRIYIRLKQFGRWFNLDQNNNPLSIIIINNIDHIDYVNRIGNRSCEQYIRARTPCYGCILGYPRCYDNLTKKWLKMMTTVHWSTNNSKTIVVSSLKKAYPSEGVSTLNVAGKV
jgi:hypothetical protein